MRAPIDGAGVDGRTACTITSTAPRALSLSAVLCPCFRTF